jgi:hypothetical protein
MGHALINYIDTKAKYRQLKKLSVKGLYREERGELTREKVSWASSQSWVENNNMTECITSL